MAPLQDHLQPLSLTDYAKKCEARLNHLKQHALDCKRRHRTDATKQLLKDVIDHIKGNTASLRAWVAEVSSGRQTTDLEIIRTTEKQFEQLQKRIEDVKDILEERLGLHFRSLRVLLLGQKEEASKRVRLALGEVDQTVGLLQNQVKLVLRDSPEQQHRTSRITDALGKRRKSYNVFVQALKDLSLAEMQSVCFGSLQILWLQFPRRHDLEGKVGNADKPGDGLIYSDSEVAEAKELLKEFYEAWSETTVRLYPNSSATLPRAGSLTDMAKICLILRGMKQERLLDCFCASQKADNCLPLSLLALQRILNADDAHHAAVFAAEQYRVVRRTWKDGGHLDIPDVEPLPLVFDDNYRSGSFGMVQRVWDPSTEAFYAQKEQTSPNARKHLRREIARLKKVRHRHIVQFVKSYQRGTRFGMLLQPAATTDLERLLIRYSRNGYDYEKDSRDRRRDQVMLYPIILTAFGCLSRGLAHIHGSNIRHKDIKPANILFEKALPPAHLARFLWADFGLAYDFGNAANSKTVSKSRYSPRYAAPEILAMSQIIVHTKAKRTKEGYPSQEISDDSEGSYEEYPEYSEGSQPINPGHGRSTDIFSFGCVFLEVLSVLVGEGPPMSDTHDFQSFAPFGRNIKKMHAWIEKQMMNLKEDHKALRPIFRLSIKMTQANPEKRPLIGDIVKELTDAGSKYFCSHCLSNPKDPIPEWNEAEIQEAKMHHADEEARGNPVGDAEAERNGIHRIDWPLTESDHDLVASQIEDSSKTLKKNLASRPRSAMRSPSAGKSSRSRSPPVQRVSFTAMDKVIGSNSNGHK